MKAAPRYKQSCGCVAQGARWVELCEAHRIEEQDYHLRAAADRQARLTKDNKAGLLPSEAGFTITAMNGGQTDGS